MAAPADLTYPPPGCVRVEPDPRDPHKVWLLHTAASGARCAIPLSLEGAQLLSEALAFEARAVLEGRP